MKVQFGKTLERDIDITRYGFNSELSPVAQHIVYIGLRNIGMDSHAGDTEDKHGADYVKFAGETLDKKLAALANGEVRVAGTRSSDPIASQMRQLALAAARKALKAQHGKAFKDLKSEIVTAETNKILAKNEVALRKIATRMVKAAAEFAVEVEV
jgi:hypothetical protein